MIDAAALQGSRVRQSPTSPLRGRQMRLSEAAATSLAQPCLLYSQSNLIPDWLSEEPMLLMVDGTRLIWPPELDPQMLYYYCS